MTVLMLPIFLMMVLLAALFGVVYGGGPNISCHYADTYSTASCPTWKHLCTDTSSGNWMKYNCARTCKCIGDRLIPAKIVLKVQFAYDSGFSGGSGMHEKIKKMFNFAKTSIKKQNMVPKIELSLDEELLTIDTKLKLTNDELKDVRKYQKDPLTVPLIVICSDDSNTDLLGLTFRKGFCWKGTGRYGVVLMPWIVDNAKAGEVLDHEIRHLVGMDHTGRFEDNALIDTIRLVDLHELNNSNNDSTDTGSIEFKEVKARANEISQSNLPKCYRYLKNGEVSSTNKQLCIQSSCYKLVHERPIEFSSTDPILVCNEVPNNYTCQQIEYQQRNERCNPDPPIIPNTKWSAFGRRGHSSENAVSFRWG